MAALAHRLASVLGRALLPASEHARLGRMPVRDAGHGYDVFGMQREFLQLAAAFVGPLYRHYFRVRSYGAEHLPSAGPAILVANHSGMLPIDATMLCMDVSCHTEPARMPRTVVDFFVPKLPVVGTFFARMGTTNGSARDLRALLAAGELVLIFPEGIEAIGKPVSERYRISQWRVGHAELALELGVPIIPVAVIGAEEQWRELFRIRALRPFGAPYVPVPMTPLPLPVRYHIHYGVPLSVPRADGTPEPSQIEALAARSRAAVEQLIAVGLRTRKGVFR